MIFAMHSANVACIARHGDSNATFVDYLRRIGVEQLLVASSTTEGRNGAKVRTSASPIVWDGDRISLSRDASVVSYGFDADAIVSTARRSSESLPTDQVLTLLFKEQYALEVHRALGCSRHAGDVQRRVLCSTPRRRANRFSLAEPYERKHRHTMMPATH